MKKFVLLILLFQVQLSYSQVAINNTNTVAHNSAMLEVSSSSKGILVPRMNLTQRIQIASPAKGLLVFDNTTNSFWYFDGSAWGELSAINANLWKPDGSNVHLNTLGNVGVGTITPVEKIDVAGSVGLTGPLKLKGNNASMLFDNVLGNKVTFWNSGSNQYGISLQSGVLQLYTDGPLSDIVFGHGNSTSLNEKVRIKGNGNVGIGDVNPASKLTIDGGFGNALELKGGIKVSGDNPAVFQLTANSGNLSDKNTDGQYESIIINNNFCNNDPNAIIMITPLVRRSGVYVQYDASISRWKIRFELPFVPSGYQNLTYAACGGGCSGASAMLTGTTNNGFVDNDKFNIMIVKR